MNFVVISPNYPESYWMFCRGLKENGAKVLAIVDTPYNQLKQELKEYCDEIYVVKSFHDYDEMVKACGYFTFKYGKIDWIESNNEAWLDLDAAYAYSNVYSKAIVISPYVLESMDAILKDIHQSHIQKNTSIYLSWGSNEKSLMHEFVWQTKACTEIGNALSKKGVNVLYNVIPEGRHCEEDWEKECDTFLPFLVQ
jgi:hypothetical protein